MDEYNIEEKRIKVRDEVRPVPKTYNFKDPEKLICTVEITAKIGCKRCNGTGTWIQKTGYKFKKKDCPCLREGALSIKGKDGNAVQTESNEVKKDLS